MDENEMPHVVVGRVARAELCSCHSSVVLTLGSLSLRLDFDAASDIAATLREILARVDPAAAPPAGPAADTPN